LHSDAPAVLEREAGCSVKPEVVALGADLCAAKDLVLKEIRLLARSCGFRVVGASRR
jgi:hypothetical protein